MRVAFTVSSTDDSSTLVRRFGRSPYFLIADTVSGARETHRNPSTDTRGGAGTQAAQFLFEQEVEAVVSGDYGPNAYAALQAAGIAMYSAEKNSIEILLQDLQADRLDPFQRTTSGSPLDDHLGKVDPRR